MRNIYIIYIFSYGLAHTSKHKPVKYSSLWRWIGREHVGFGHSSIWSGTLVHEYEQFSQREIRRSLFTHTGAGVREKSDALCSIRNVKTVVCIRNLFILHYWLSNPSDLSEVWTTAWNHLLYVWPFCEYCLQCLHLDGQKYVCKQQLSRPRLLVLSVQHHWHMWAQTIWVCTVAGCYLCLFWRTQTDLDNTLMERRGWT